MDGHAGQIRLAPEGNYPPFSFIESGAWHGLSADMIQLLQARLGTRFQVLPAQNLNAILANVQGGRAEVVTSLKETPERAQYLAFTQPYISVPTAIIVKSGFSPGRWPDAFVGKRVAVGKGYGVQGFLEQKFPTITLTLVPDDLDGMQKLAFGEVDALIMDVASASFFIEREKFSNLQIFSAFDYSYDLSFGVRKDLPVLRDILSKTLASLPEQERQAVSDKWIHLHQDSLALILESLAPWMPWVGGVLAALLLACGLVFRSRQQRRQLEQTASKYSRSLIEASLDPLVTISTQGKITDVNQATEQVTGVGRTQLIGSDFADYFTDPVQAREGYQQVFANGFVTDYPLAIRHTSGRITDVLYNASVYRDDAGRVLGVFAAARDVTERKKAEESIQAASVFTYAREGIMITHANGAILNVNEAFTRLLAKRLHRPLLPVPAVLTTSALRLALGELALMSGELASQSSLDLPGRQQELMEAVAATGKPVVLVLVNGRPLNITWAASHVPAILAAWHPGMQGGNALADLLFGDANPSGKLPLSWPRNAGQTMKKRGLAGA